jgi:hypothetical protein
MPTLAERRLAEFVDRDAEMGTFTQLLERDDKSIMVVWGDSGLGKSSLLAKMIHESAQRGIRRCELTWTDTRPHDYMAVMRKIRDDLGPSRFSAFTDLVNFYTNDHYELTINVGTAPVVNVATGASFKESTVGDIAGVIVKDLMVTLPRSDLAVPEAERMVRLTDRFIEDCRSVTAAEPAIIFLDAVEKMSTDTEKWIWGEFLAVVRDGRLAKVKCVLCGQRKPVLEREWDFCCELAELKPLSRAHIVSYLEKRGVEEQNRQALATLLFVQTDGRISDVAKQVDAFLKFRAQQES